MARPRFISPCNADRYADKSRERIAEFSFPDADGAGGLIALRYREGKPPLVSVYRADGCEVVTPRTAAIREIVNAAFEVVDADGDPSPAIGVLRSLLDKHFPYQMEDGDTLESVPDA